MGKRWYGLFLAMFVLSSEVATAQMVGIGEGGRFELEIRRWRPRFRSELKVGGDSVDPKADLGLSDPRELEYKGFLRLGRWVKLRGSGTVFTLDQASTLPRDITYAGEELAQGTSVDTALEMRHLKGGVEVDIYAFREGFLAVIADYSAFEAEPILTGPETVANAGKLDVKLVTLGLKGRVYLTPALALTVEAEGMKKETSGVITDFEGVMTYNLSRNFAISFGYRNLYTKWLKEGRATFRLEGYFFSGTIRI